MRQLRHALPFALLLLSLVAPACGDSASDEPLGSCGLPLSQCEADTFGGDAALDSVGDDVVAPDAIDVDEDGGAVDDGATGDGATDDGATADTTAPAEDPTAWIVDAGWLAARLDDAEIVVVDVRDEGSWSSARIPGALHVSVSDVRATVDGVSGQVASAEQVAQTLAAAGLPPGTTAVVAGPATDTTTARLVWTLRYFGHDARLLDGGYASWTGASDSHTPTIEATSYPTPTAVDDLRVTGAWVLDHLDDADVVLVDARTAGEYGAGHIPGALSVPWQDNVSGAALKDRATVAALYDAVPSGATVVAYCASGTRASVTWLVLRWLGFEDVRLYDGSWAEWSTLPGAPVE